MHGVNGGKPRGMLYAGGDIFQTDLPGQTMTKDAVRNLGSTAGQEQTYTCVPSGSGTRIAIDRDEDTLFNGVETNTGTFVNASDTGTNPAAADTDGDGFDDASEIAAPFTDPNDPLDFPGAAQPAVPAFGPAGLVTLASLLALTAVASLRRSRVGSG